MNELEQTRTPGFRRREVLAAAGAVGLGLVWTNGRGWIDAAGAAVDEEAVAAASCTLSKELTEGPYWIENGLTRRDVTGNRHGVPLTLVLTVEDSSTCRVIKRADVEIWHADADGDYSGIGSAGSSSRWLRGHQKTNAKGVARFETIYPGWYTSRTPHIHLKVHVGGNEVHTGQLFFKESVTRAVYRTRYYRSRGQADTTNTADNIYERGSLLQLSKRKGERSYIGRKTLVVDA
jgi:protocatechuate 3,4-dioxygenase beta subunit